MITRRLWREMRLRFWISAGLVALLVGAMTLALRTGLVPSGARSVGAASTFADHAALLLWEGGGEGSPITVWTVFLPAAVLALGGVLAEDERGTAALTLTLPVPRWRWLAAHAGLAVAGAAALAVGQAALVAAVALGVPGPAAGDLALSAAGAVVGALPFVGLTLAAGALLRDVRTTAAVAVIAVVLVGFVTQRPYLQSSLFPWMPEALLDPARWRSGAVWRPLVVTVGSAAVFGGFALRRLEGLEL